MTFGNLLHTDALNMLKSDHTSFGGSIGQSHQHLGKIITISNNLIQFVCSVRLGR